VVKSACIICGHKSQLWALEQYHIVPLEITRKGGMTESKTVLLCRVCRQELEEWYLTKVANMVFDTMAKRFRDRSCAEMVKEYEYSYYKFVDYKRKQLGLD
jgi:hypothetical protein